MALITRTSRRTAVLAGAVSVALLAGACGGSGSGSSTAGAGASVLFILVIPIVAYNIRQIRSSEA